MSTKKTSLLVGVALVVVAAFLSVYSIFSIGSEGISPQTQIPVFGPEKYIRDTEKPQKTIKTFSIINPNDEFTIVIQNGEGGSERVSSAVIELNDVQVAGPNEFNQRVDQVKKPIKLQQNNQIAVELMGSPGSSISVCILGKINENYQTFTSQAAGFTLTFPTFGAQYNAFEEPASDGTPGNIQIYLQNIRSPEGPQYEPFISIDFVNNPDQKDIDAWFHDYVDPTGVLYSNNSFTRRTLKNGIEVYILSGPSPDAYDSGPVSFIYAMIPSKHMIFSIDGAQDTSLQDFIPGSSNDEISKILLDVAESIQY